ncbi:thiamine pyrophosphate-binding protein [Cupriavidus consociatus]|uniref:thiamine pyrophosphate-binding protein n=1 Tax=Cupriavidus consociatus TaxID=2821357 RepID=UPI001AE7864C|nr:MULTISPECIES: thiamine pyrophosphate-binding protein [unclassified Cupriavidus]MBP0625326.1 thiamine pyrophosphate-binding protein [Cupriavidus sp. LEh25]MDK2662063.1 thiamine pyrophosphate-binding protein [Cupriavidus sp. LEh21]
MSKIAGHLLVECLVEQGCEVAFGVPGESFLAVLDGFHRYRDRIRFVGCRQEGGASFMAEAHGKLTRRPGVCIVTRGPGATNAAIGVHTAFQDSTPMVLLIGDVGSDFRDREAFQEVDFAAFFGPSTKGMAKRVERIDDPHRIPEYIARAFATAMNGRPGPVVLVLPEDMLVQETDARPVRRIEAAGSAATDRDLQRFRELLAQSRRPLVLAGGAYSPQAAQQLQRFAEAWHLPVANTFRFQDTFDNHHELYAGDVGIGVNPKLAKRVQESDLIIALGARLGEMTTSGYTLLQPPQPTQRLVHVHSSGEELNRVYRADLAIHATMDSFVEQLAMLDPPPDVPWQSWAISANADYLENLVSEALPGLDQSSAHYFDMPGLIGTLQKYLPADAVLTNGAGNFASWLHRYYRFHGLAKGHKTQLAPTVGAMGYGVPAGIAANLVTGRVAFTIAGDGDFLMNGQELATAVQHGAKSIILLVDNGMYGTIRMHQEREYPQHVCGTDLCSPDFCSLARSYGYEGIFASNLKEFEQALIRALENQSGTLIHIRLSAEIISTRRSLSAIRKEALHRQTD